MKKKDKIKQIINLGASNEPLNRTLSNVSNETLDLLGANMAGRMNCKRTGHLYDGFLKCTTFYYNCKDSITNKEYNVSVSNCNDSHMWQGSH